MFFIYPTAQIPGQPVEMQFSGDTPAVVGDRIYVQVTVSPTRALLCQLITRGPPQMPNFIAEHDCEFQLTTFYFFSVTLGYMQALVAKLYSTMSQLENTE